MSLRHAAFLRAINVGKRRVKMDDLAAVFTGLGLGGVSTFIASGNVVFDHEGELGPLEARLEAGLAEALGFEVDTFVRSVPVLADLVRFDDLVEGPDDTLRIGFLREPAAPDALDALAGPMDAVRIVGRELYWLCRTRSEDSPLGGPLLERALGQPTTLRRLRTVGRMVEKYG